MTNVKTPYIISHDQPKTAGGVAVTDFVRPAQAGDDFAYSDPCLWQGFYSFIAISTETGLRRAENMIKRSPLSARLQFRFKTKRLYKVVKYLPKNEEKQVIINEIKEKIGRAASVVLVDGRGLTVHQDTRLRKTLRDAGVEYKVYKNTMLEIAFKDTAFAGLTPYLAGPTTAAISYDDPTIAARVINKELKGLPNLEFKAGFVENTVYDAKGIKAIADIPSKNELLARLLGSLKSPMSSFARVVSQIAESKGGGQAPAAEQPTA